MSVLGAPSWENSWPESLTWGILLSALNTKNSGKSSVVSVTFNFHSL